MGRPKLHRVRVKVGIDEDIYAELETLLIDPIKGRLKYGALSSITNRLYRQFLDTLRKPGVDPIQYLEAYGVDVNLTEEEDEDDDV